MSIKTNSEPKFKIEVIGIDLGTTNSCVAIWQNNQVEILPNHLGARTTPSWIALLEPDKPPVIGEPARRQAAKFPRNTIFDVKRLIGRHFAEIESDLDNYPYEIISDTNGRPLISITFNNHPEKPTRTYKPEEISAMVLRYLKGVAENHLGYSVHKAVITVPAYFNDAQRQATKNAATIAGLECIRTLNEPTAACLCYGLNNVQKDLNVQVVDWGGGTLDCSLLNLDGGVFQVIATCGDSHLGGEDIDWLMVKHVCGRIKYPVEDLYQSPRNLKRLQIACEKAKCELSTGIDAEIYLENFASGEDLQIIITPTEFDDLIKDIIDRVMTLSKQVLKDADLTIEEIDEVILVGGSTRIPVLQTTLSRYFNNKRLNKSVNPDEAIAYGAAVQSAILTTNDIAVRDLVLLDVIPLSLGIETSGGLMAPIIERNTNIPCRQSKMFTTAEDNQSSVLVQVYEGIRKFTKDNHRLGTFELGPIPEAPRGVAKIEVTFAVDSDGILQVSAMDKNTGLATEANLTPESGRLSQADIQNMIQQATSNQLQDERKLACLEAYTTFEKYLFSVQQTINDSNINASLDESDRSFVNKYLINSFQWINDNREDPETTCQVIENARMSVEHNLKPLMKKLFSY